MGQVKFLSVLANRQKYPQKSNMNQDNALQKSFRSSDIALVITACAVGLMMTFLVYSGNFIFGSVKGVWMYRYFEETSPLPRWIPVTALALLASSVFIGTKLILIREKTTVIVTFFLLLILQFVIREAYPFPLGETVTSDKSNSFYTPTLQHSPLEILRDFETLSATFPLHARSNMPGKILFFEFLGGFTTAPETMGALIVVCSSLGGLLLYSICRKMFNDRIAAFYALILYSLIPCRLFFLPLLNTITPLFMLILLLLTLMFTEKSTILNAWLTGAAVYLLIFFEPSPLVTGLIPVGVLLYSFLNNKITKQDTLHLIVHAPLAFLVLHLIFRVLFSFDLFETLRFVLRDAAHFNLLAGRGYRIWFGENLKEFFYSAGTPSMVIFIYVVALLLPRWDELKTRKNLTPETVFTLSLLATFAVVVFLGINRGEISRLWIYLAVLFQVPAAVFIAKIEKSALPFFLFAGALAIQTLLPLHRVGFVVP